MTDDQGEPLNRRSRWLVNRPSIAEPDPAMPAYAVQTLVPDYWLPLIPQAIAPGAIHFLLGWLQQSGIDAEPHGHLLNGSPDEADA